MYSDAGMWGSLDAWPLDELINWLHQTGRTAKLTIEIKGATAELFFLRGVLRRAEWGAQQGEEAVRRLLDARTGTFLLTQREIPAVSPNVSEPTHHLLLRWALSVDHGERPQASA